MRNSIFGSFVLLTVIGLLTVSCSPLATATPVPKATSVPSKVEVPGKDATAPASPSSTPKASSEQARYGGILTRALARDVPTFDLQREQGSDASATIFNVYEGLVRLDPIEHEKIVPELADKWDVSQDGKTYTFKFAKGVKWHDGKPFTTEDVTYSLERMHDPRAFKTLSPRGEALLTAMDAAKVVDEETVTVTAKYPSASFLGNLASGWIAIQPKSIMVAKGDMRRDCIGTGPFKLKQFNANISMELVKNPDYHIKGLPYLDGINLYTITDGSTRFAAFRTGRVKVTHVGATALTAPEAEIVRRDMADKITVFDHDRLSRSTLTFNFHKKPFDDVRVRKAADLAIDRQAALKIAGAAFIGSIYSVPWGMPLPEVEKLPGYRPNKDADIAEARRLLAEAGYPNGFSTTLLSRSGTTYEPFGVIYKDHLAKIGIRTDLTIVDPTTLYDRFERRQFDIVTMSWAEATTDPDETLFAYYATGGSRNYGDFSNPEIDALIEKQAKTMDKKAREDILLEIERKTIELVPMVISFKSLGLVGAWKEVRNFSVGPGIHAWSKLDHVWLAK